MADDTSLLFRIRADNAQAKATLADTRNAVSQLRTSFGSEMNQLQSASTTALGKVTQSLTQVASQIPVVGGTVGNLTSQFSSLSTSATTSAGSVGLVAGAAVVAASALGSLLKTVFDITVQAAEFQGKMFDLSQQTGVNVETLSTLEIVAKTTGGNIEGITASLGIFQKKLEDALDPTSKEAALLKTLGIETNNTEEAFRQALSTLAAMPEGFQQTALALELFGRGGKAILAILKEMDGDLDGTTEKFREMGILISTDAAKAADTFNDQLALLGFQIRSVTAIIGNEAMPEILRALTTISKAFEDNQSTITAWTRDTADAARGALILADAVKSIGTQITGLSNLPVPGILQLLGSVSGATGILRGLRSLGTPEIGALPVPDLATPLQPSTSPSATTIDQGKSDKARAEAERRAQRAIQSAFKALEETTRQSRIELERERNLDLVNIDEWEKRSLDIADAHAKRQAELFDQEIATVRKYVTNKTDLLQALIEIEQKKTKESNAHLNERNKIQDEAQKRRDKAEIDLNRQLAAIRDAAREGEIAKIQDALARQEILETEAATRLLALLKDEHEQRLLLIQIELEQETTSADRKIQLDNERIASEQKYTNEKGRLTQERIDAANREAAANAPGVGRGVAGLSDDDIGRAAGAAADAAAGLPPWVADATDAFGSLGQAISNALGLGKEGAEFFGNVLTSTFSQLAVAVGDAVHAFVLFGNAGGGIKKFTATVIAEIARMAAIQAVWELAQGFAMLALNFFWPDPKLAAAATAHFHAAAIYGGLAAVAAAAGRVVAGNSFTQSGGGSGSTGSGNQGRNPSDRRQSTGDIAPIDVDRRNASQPIVQTIEFRVKGGVIVDEFAQDYMLNGRTRFVIKSDGQG